MDATATSWSAYNMGLSCKHAISGLKERKSFTDQRLSVYQSAEHVRRAMETRLASRGKDDEKHCCWVWVCCCHRQSAAWAQQQQQPIFAISQQRAQPSSGRAAVHVTAKARPSPAVTRRPAGGQAVGRRYYVLHYAADLCNIYFIKLSNTVRPISEVTDSTAIAGPPTMSDG